MHCSSWNVQLFMLNCKFFVSDDAQVQKTNRDAYPMESQKGGISLDSWLVYMHNSMKSRLTELSQLFRKNTFSCHKLGEKREIF